jgi:hypothetical protein
VYVQIRTKITLGPRHVMTLKDARRYGSSSIFQQSLEINSNLRDLLGVPSSRCGPSRHKSHNKGHYLTVLTDYSIDHVLVLAGQLGISVCDLFGLGP